MKRLARFTIGLIGIAASAGAQTLINGSFELQLSSSPDPSYPDASFDPDLVGWVENYTDKDFTATSGTYYVPSDGNQLLGLYFGSGVSQTFAVSAGDQFTVSLDHSWGGVFDSVSNSWKNYADGGSFRIAVSGAGIGFSTGEELAMKSFDPLDDLGSPHLPNPLYMGTYTSPVFTATSAGNVELQILSAATGPSAPAIAFFDNVQISKVPEPSSAFLCLALAGGLLLRSRRR